MNLTTNNSTLPEELKQECAPQAPEFAFLAGPNPSECHVQISRIVREISQPQVRGIVGTVFTDLLRLLECLEMIEGHLRQVDAADETFALFQIIYEEACRMVDFIRADGLSCGEMNEELIDTLDGITFAVNHDLQRVFEGTPGGQTSEPNAQVVVGKLYRAHDILTNCLQQSTITLAMNFDGELAGAKLFNNSEMRYRQSLQLCQDLSVLIAIVQECDENVTEAGLTALSDGIEKFRSESMECLMYSDWPQFEGFCERIKLSSPNPADTKDVLHQFRCYLETLLGQVRMRAVLANVFPIQFGGGDDNGQTPLVDENSQSRQTSRDEEESRWDSFAYAV